MNLIKEEYEVDKKRCIRRSSIIIYKNGNSFFAGLIALRLLIEIINTIEGAVWYSALIVEVNSSVQ